MREVWSHPAGRRLDRRASECPSPCNRNSPIQDAGPIKGRANEHVSASAVHKVVHRVRRAFGSVLFLIVLEVMHVTRHDHFDTERRRPLADQMVLVAPIASAGEKRMAQEDLSAFAARPLQGRLEADTVDRSLRDTR